jgi:hypothetical protein
MYVAGVCFRLATIFGYRCEYQQGVFPQKARAVQWFSKLDLDTRLLAYALQPFHDLELYEELPVLLTGGSTNSNVNFLESAE